MELSRRLSFQSSHVLLLNDLAQIHAKEGRVEVAFSYFEQAEALSQAFGQQGERTNALLRRTSLERRVGHLAQAQALLEEAEARLGTGVEPVLRSLYRCERGHLELAAGRPEAASNLEELRALAAQTRCGPNSELARGLARLERAVAAFLAGQQLFRGECWEDLPPGLQRWLLSEQRRGQ